MKMKYGERLKSARERAGLSQDDLAKRTCGAVKQGSISKIERGDQERSTFDIDLAIALDIHPKWLKDGDLRFALEWLKPGENYAINEKQINYTSHSLSTNEKLALKLLKMMADFQQEEWLQIGEKMAAKAAKFRRALTPDFKNGDYG